MNKEHEPVSAKWVNIWVTITAILTLVIWILMICYLTEVKKTYDYLGSHSGQSVSPSGSGIDATEAYSTSLVIVSIVYMVCLIITFVKSLRFRKMGGGRALSGLMTTNFVIGIIVIVITFIMEFVIIGLGLALGIFGTAITLGTTGANAFVTSMKIASYFLYVPVILFAVCVILAVISVIVGWVSLRKSKVSHANVA